jgi:hypothetical protein
MSPGPRWPVLGRGSDVYYQPLPEVVPEEQDVHADHDGYQREHVKYDGYLSSHRFVLLCATEWSKNGGSAGARMYGNFTARTRAQVWCSARRTLQVSSLGCAGIHDRDKSQVRWLNRTCAQGPASIGKSAAGAVPGDDVSPSTADSLPAP